MVRDLKLRAAAAAAAMACLVVLVGNASATATFQIINNDGPGEGFNDAAPFTPVGGNDATTLGQARLNAFQYAADIWGGLLQSDVPIRVSAQMNPLTCGPSSAVLGSAGTAFVVFDFVGAPLPDTYYPVALGNAIAGFDIVDAGDDINAQFNSSLNGDAGCLGGASWYYGLDGNPPPGDIDFVTVVLHELGHGLGFQTYVDLATGQRFNGRDDMYMALLEQAGASPSLWRDMDDAQRVASAVGDPALRWVGAHTSHMQTILGVSAGLSGPHVRMHAPSVLAPGSSVAHWTPAVTPNEVMEPSYTGANHDPGLATFLMMDMGWPMDASVAVTFREIAARDTGDAVELTWRFAADELVAGFRVHRREGAGTAHVVSGDALLPATARSFTDTDVRPGAVYRYRVAAVKPGGEEVPSPDVVVVRASYQVALAQNHPNPFNAATEIRYRLERDGPVTLRIHDISGRLVRTLVDGPRTAGDHTVPWYGRDDRGRVAASGSYFYLLEAGGERRIRRMVLLK